MVWSPLRAMFISSEERDYVTSQSHVTEQARYLVWMEQDGKRETFFVECLYAEHQSTWCWYLAGVYRVSTDPHVKHTITPRGELTVVSYEEIDVDVLMDLIVNADGPINFLRSPDLW
jgi:hypothetical protein